MASLFLLYSLEKGFRMFKFKKIDLESKGYKALRKGVGMFSGAGAGWTLECMSIPWVQAVFSHNKFVRIMCYSGIVPIAVLVDLLAEGTTETLIDSFADIYNLAVDKINGEDEEDAPYVSYTAEPEVEVRHKFIGIDIPDKNATPEEEKKFVDDVVLKTRIFEFDTEDGARELATELTTTLIYAGPVLLSGVFDVVGWTLKLPKEVRDILDKYGWVGDDKEKIAYEHSLENTWIVDAFNYHDISDQYVILYKGAE